MITRIGTAGWSIPRASAARFEGQASHLERYASVFPCVEINSSFHRSHRATTYARWAASTPAGFSFCVKLPRVITHDLGLRRPRVPLAQFMDEISGLGVKRGPLLVQLPPSFDFDRRVVGRFLAALRSSDASPIVCEPRHASWFSSEADALLRDHAVARVAADPPPVAGGDRPGGWQGLLYYRLHGAPRKYWSRYGAAFIARLASTLRAAATRSDVWCIFDNTASGAAMEDAWELQALLS